MRYAYTSMYNIRTESLYAVCTCIGARQCVQRVKRSSEPTTTMTGSHRRVRVLYRCSITRFNNRNF